MALSFDGSSHTASTRSLGCSQLTSLSGSVELSGISGRSEQSSRATLASGPDVRSMRQLALAGIGQIP